MSASNNLPASSSHSQTTHAELDQLLGDVRTSNPQELLGAGAETSLSVAMLQATVITVGLLLAFTFGPLLWTALAGHSAPKPEPAPREAVKAPAPAATTPAAPATTPDNAKTTDTTKAPPIPKEALDKLGVNEIKKGDPKVNPLDKGDDLFNDIDKKLEKK